MAKDQALVSALVKGRRIDIESLDDLADAVESSRQAREALILLGNHNERYEFPLAAELTDEQRREARLATRGSLRSLIDGENLKRDMYASRGQEGRDWMIAEDKDILV